MTRLNPRRKNIPGPLRRELAKKYGAEFGKVSPANCYWCNEPGQIYWTHTPGWVCFSLEIDHLTPLARGGEDEISNLVLACRKCNRGRFNKKVAA
jgi:5-methylcytosine-specific restriction endonuclease McrA